ncbi:MAG: NAD(P)H-hydrate epimerase [Blastopirellula sp.]|nr:MAG: NAD(P)H-hydrate epimerase [Blastopirellula sp.]
MDNARQLNRPYLTRLQSREIDQFAITVYGMSGIVLMENAGRGCAELLLKQNPQHVVICCGPGNNGGDGFVIARHLDLLGVSVHVLLFREPNLLSGDAEENWLIIEMTDISYSILGDTMTALDLERYLEKADWIVDALLGTGSHGEPKDPYNHVIELINSQTAQVMAVDIPSGLDCDTGAAADATIKANITATFVAPKVGFKNDNANKYLGEVHVVDIGTSRCLLRGVFKRSLED